MRSVILGCVIFLVGGAAAAQEAPLSDSLFSRRPARELWRVNWAAVEANTLQDQQKPDDTSQPLHTAAVEHSDAYQTRAKIHKYASVATLPLFATELVLGQSMYDGNNTNLRGLHAAVGAGIVGLFGVNTVTGAWNLFGEGWNDKDGRRLRLAHGLLMMAADVGFVLTTQSGPNSRRAFSFETDKSTHRNMAIASISIGTAGYLLMLIANH
jgi:hypothetical protein